MTEHWTVYVLVFGAVFLAFQGLQGIILARRDARRTAARFATLDIFSQNRAEIELLKKRGALSRQKGLLGSLNRLIVQSGTNLKPIHLGLIYFLLLMLIFWPASKWGTGVGLAAGSLLSLALLLVILRYQRSRRIAKFGEQLPDVIDIVVRSLKAGHPLPVSLSLVGREMSGPAGPEFTVVFDEISYGREVREALENLYDRVGHPDLRFLITSIAVAHQTGGNLGEILSRLSKLIRDRFKIRRKIKALSAEGRSGGFVLSIVPLVIFGLVTIMSPNYYAEFWGHPTQNMMLLVGLVLLSIGNFIIYKLVNFKV